MKTITVQLPDEETKLFKQLLKKFNAKIISQSSKPNRETIKAMEELKAGKGVKFESVDELFKSV